MTIFVSIIVGIVCALLYRLAHGLENTAKINAALAAIESERQAILNDARAQSARLIADARDLATRMREQEVRHATVAAAQIVRQARETAAREHPRMLANRLGEATERGVVRRTA